MLCEICKTKEANINYNYRCEDCYIEGVIGICGITVGTNFKTKIDQTHSRPYNQRHGMMKTRS